MYFYNIEYISVGTDWKHRNNYHIEWSLYLCNIEHISVGIDWNLKHQNIYYIKHSLYLYIIEHFSVGVDLMHWNNYDIKSITSICNVEHISVVSTSYIGILVIMK